MAPDWTAELGAGPRRIKRYYPPDPDQAGLNAKGLNVFIFENQKILQQFRIYYWCQFQTI